MAWQDVAAELTSASPSGKAVAVLGGGFCGLACAYEFARRGYGVAVIDCGAQAGLAPASSAAAGLLDPLTPKGRLAWMARDAMDAALRLLQASANAHKRPLFQRTGAVHVPRDAKHAKSLREGASELDSATARWLGCDAAAALVGCGDGFQCAPDGVLHCPEAVVVDTQRYLEALWHLSCACTVCKWICKRVETVRALAEHFDVVVIAAGAGCCVVEETRHLPVELSRGQVLEYAPNTTVGSGDGGGSCCWDLRLPLTGSVYVVPQLHPHGGFARLDCGGTYEPCECLRDAWQDAPPNASVATDHLDGALKRLFPALRDAGTPVKARAGVRATPPRSALGAAPLIGRAHSSAGQDNVWFCGGMGSRGLLYHALAAGWLADAATNGDASRLPDEVRRCEFGHMLARKLAVLAERQQADQESDGLTAMPAM